MDNVKRQYRSPLRAEQSEATRRRILEASRRLFARTDYQDATMEALAEEAGVAVQTLYVAFGSKFALACAVCDDTLERAGIPEQVAQFARATDVDQALQLVARVNCRVNEHLVDVLDLLNVARVRESRQAADDARARDLAGVVAMLIASPRRRQDLSDAEVRDVLLALTAPMLYRMLVKESGWTPQRYEQWLSDTLVSALLN